MSQQVFFLYTENNKKNNTPGIVGNEQKLVCEKNSIILLLFLFFFFILFSTSNYYFYYFFSVLCGFFMYKNITEESLFSRREKLGLFFLCEYFTFFLDRVGLNFLHYFLKIIIYSRWKIQKYKKM